MSDRKAKAARQLFDWKGERVVKRDMRARVDKARTFDQILAASQVSLPEDGSLPVRHRRGKQRGR